MTRKAAFSVMVGVAWASAGAAWASGPEARLPDRASVVAEAQDESHLDVYVDLPAHFVKGEPSGAGERLDEAWLEGYVRSLFRSHQARGVRSVEVWALDPANPDGGWVSVASLLPVLEPPAARANESRWDPTQGPRRALVATDAPGRTVGSLAGKVVYISAGHGFTWTSSIGRWATQRGNTNDIVEDLVSAEAVNHYMVNYLVNAGATVFTAREHDMNPEMVIVDAEPAGATTTDGAGTYSEQGAGWGDSSQAGFRAGLAPYQGEVNPFTAGGNRIVEAVSGQPTAWAQWVPEVPADGHYHVYVSYTQHASRVKDARYVIHHPGGQTEVRVDQERHGRTWVDLGRFWFYAGSDAANGSVRLYNDSEEPGDFISADAVRLGGGMGDFDRGDGSGVADGPVSGRPRWEECSRYNIQFSGAPSSVYAISSSDRSDDVSARSRYAAWQNEQGEDAVYVAWHTNAPDPGRGTSTYVYGSNPPNGSYDFSGTAGSDTLATLLHDEIVGDIQASFDPSWRDRGIRSAYFGEVNPGHNPEMPAVLVEVAFHSTAADAEYLKQPRFRQVVARAYYQGIARYFAQKSNAPLTLLPEPPEALHVVGLDRHSARVSWSPPPTDDIDLRGDAATAYVVYRSDDGRAFDNGTTVVGATELVVDGLQPNVPAYFRVTAINPGGESFSTPTVAVSTACDGRPGTLLVHGFYRLDGSSLPVDDLSTWSLGAVKRLRQQEVNSFAYLVEHARAFAASNVPFDSAEATAVERGALSLDPYLAVDWALGEESTDDETFNAAEQGLVSAWLGQGGGRVLLASGAEVLWDLEEKGSAADVAFAHATFGAALQADSAETFGVVGTGAFAGLPTLQIDNGTMGSYLVFYPDVLTPLAGAEAVLSYDNGAGAAGIWHQAAGFSAALLGVPLEALHPESARHALVNAIVDTAQIPTVPLTGCGGMVADTVAEAPPDTTGADTTSGDTATADTVPPFDTGTIDTSAIDFSGPGTTALTPGRNTRVTSLRPDDGCAGGESPGPWGLVALLAAAVPVLRRRRGRPASR